MVLMDGTRPDEVGKAALTHRFQNNPNGGLIPCLKKCQSAALRNLVQIPGNEYSTIADAP
jgi:hypothetical protein